MRCRMAFGAGERLRYEIVTAVILFAFFELAPSADLSQGLAPLQAMLSFGFGGYIAGRVRRSVAGPAEEVEIRDGVPGWQFGRWQSYLVRLWPPWSEHPH